MPQKKSNQNIKAVSLLLRAGLAIVFLYAAISAIRTPEAWISYVPSFTTRFVSAKTSLDGISTVQIILSIVLLSGKYVRYAAALSAALLAGIIVFNFSTLLITFRDIGLVFMAVALAVLGE
jgi:uncharacterized membrane protein YphA (DoxX/SURF4 family)